IGDAQDAGRPVGGQPLTDPGALAARAARPAPEPIPAPPSAHPRGTFQVTAGARMTELAATTVMARLARELDGQRLATRRPRPQAARTALPQRPTRRGGLIRLTWL